MPRQGAVRVNALGLVAEGKSGQAEIVDALGGRGRDAAPQAHEPAVAIGEEAPKLCGVEVGEDLDQAFHHLVDVDDERRVGIERRGLDIGGQQTPLAVDDIRPPERFGQRPRHRRAWLDHLPFESESDELDADG